MPTNATIPIVRPIINSLLVLLPPLNSLLLLLPPLEPPLLPPLDSLLDPPLDPPLLPPKFIGTTLEERMVYPPIVPFDKPEDIATKDA